MRAPGSGLLDTSVFIARETARPLGDLPERVAVSVIVMVSWARLVSDCQRAGIQRAVKLTDALIAATAIEHGLPVVAQDGDDVRIAAAHPPLRVLKV